jgi:hypothetical protein
VASETSGSTRHIVEVGGGWGGLRGMRKWATGGRSGQWWGRLEGTQEWAIGEGSGEQWGSLGGVQKRAA